jgi:uncharacterized protein YprB with RNaseH-like and TPR domain
MKELEIFLDVETGWGRELTVFGFRSLETSVVQLVGSEITRSRVLKELPRSGKLYTYNGHSFDLSRIRSELGLDLRERFDSWDLRWICQRNGICGGQKAIERRMGIRRATEGIDGMEALYLWARYLRGDEKALQTLLRYNAEDLEGLVAIKRDLARRGLLRK